MVIQRSAVKSDFPPMTTLAGSGDTLSDCSALLLLADNDDGVHPNWQTDNSYTPSPTRPLEPIELERLAHLDRLKLFLATAPFRWDDTTENGAPISSLSSVPVGPGSLGSEGLPDDPDHLSHLKAPHPALNRFLLPNQEFVTCVLWNGLYYISGTDIVRTLVFRFEALGRPVYNMHKFEECIFSDLRKLKPGVDASLEELNSPFLDFLFKYQCIRVKKKQKVFHWFSVPHDRLFFDALERDLNREKMGLTATSQVVGEPALSSTYNPGRSLYEQFCDAREGEVRMGDRL